MSLPALQSLIEVWDREPEFAMSEMEGAQAQGLSADQVFRRYMKHLELSPELPECSEFYTTIAYWYDRARGTSEQDLVCETFRRYIDREFPPIEIEQWAPIGAKYEIPRIKTGIGSLDVLTGGGVGGVILISGDEKTGKSFLVNTLVAEASLQGWRSGWSDAELMIENRTQRVHAYAGRRMAAEDWQRITPLKVNVGCGADHILEMMYGCSQTANGRFLGVVDSVNSVATSNEGDAYFRHIEAIGRAAAITTRESGGRIAWILVSEHNQKGGAKGGKLTYWCDFHIKITRGGGRVKQMKLALSRHSPDGDLGDFELIPEKAALAMVELDGE